MFTFVMLLVTTLTNYIAYRIGISKATKKYARELAIERSDYLRLKLDRDRIKQQCDRLRGIQERNNFTEEAEQQLTTIDQQLQAFRASFINCKHAASKATALALLVLCFTGCDVQIVDQPRAFPPAAQPQNQNPNQNCPDGSCDLTYTSYTPEVPAMNLPRSMRVENWAPHGEGSCAHASTVHSLRWQGLLEEADFWRRTHHSGETISRLSSKLSAKGIEHAYTDQGDAEFLEWASRTRRGAVIWYYPAHAINFVGYHDGQAYLLDNNRPDTYITVEKQQFIRNWRGYGGVALAPVYSPTPPLLYTGT